MTSTSYILVEFSKLNQQSVFIEIYLAAKIKCTCSVFKQLLCASKLLTFTASFPSFLCNPLVLCSLSIPGMGAPKIAHAAYKGPSIMKEIFYGISLGLAAGFLWKMHHWSEQRKRKEFYDLLDAGRITTVVSEEDE